METQQFQIKTESRDYVSSQHIVKTAAVFSSPSLEQLWSSVVGTKDTHDAHNLMSGGGKIFLTVQRWWIM